MTEDEEFRKRVEESIKDTSPDFDHDAFMNEMDEALTSHSGYDKWFSQQVEISLADPNRVSSEEVFKNIKNRNKP